MTDPIRIASTDDLRKIAFKVCTHLSNNEVTAVLTGGSAATVYAPEAYQSRDVDLILHFYQTLRDVENLIAEIGWEREGRIYVHPAVPIMLDFPDDNLMVGGEAIESFDTLSEDGLLLHVLNPTDCVRDRLAHFYWYHDRSALAAALAVARSYPIDLEIIAAWSEREGETGKFTEFRERAEGGVGL